VGEGIEGESDGEARGNVIIFPGHSRRQGLRKKNSYGDMYHTNSHWLDYTGRKKKLILKKS
jgi:hypothetical protein